MYLKAFYYFHISFRYLYARIMDSNLNPSKGNSLDHYLELRRGGGFVIAISDFCYLFAVTKA